MNKGECFCGGRLMGVSEHTDYSQCESCGSWISLRDGNPKDLYTADYWTPEQKRSTPMEQCENLRMGRLQLWMDMARAVGESKSVYEIGCAPGVFLQEMRDAGWEASGCEGSAIENVLFDGDVEIGLFPDDVKNISWLGYDLVACFDVFEHFPDVKGALLAMRGLGEYLLIQTPVVYPGVDMPERMWLPDEHVHVFSEKGIQWLWDWAGLEVVRFERYEPGHEIYLLKRKDTRNVRTKRTARKK